MYKLSRFLWINLSGEQTANHLGQISECINQEDTELNRHPVLQRQNKTNPKQRLQESISSVCPSIEHTQWTFLFL